MANWKNGHVNIGNDLVDYLAFGRGRESLIMIPGVGDGLKTVRGMALPFSLMYRKAGSQFRVYAFSRRRHIPEGYTTRQMAEDVYLAARALGIEKAHILGVSQGGMIAQYLAADYPEFADRLVLTVTADRMEPEYAEVIKRWIQMAEAGDYAGIMTDTAERSYSERYLKLARPMYGLAARFGKPKDFTRFILQADSCLTHDSSEILSRIACPVLVLGGGCDRIVGPEGSRRLAEGIRDAQLYMYERYGHGAYEEAKDFQDRLLDFLKKETR